MPDFTIAVPIEAFQQCFRYEQLEAAFDRVDNSKGPIAIFAQLILVKFDDTGELGVRIVGGVLEGERSRELMAVLEKDTIAATKIFDPAQFGFEVANIMTYNAATGSHEPYTLRWTRGERDQDGIYEYEIKKTFGMGCNSDIAYMDLSSSSGLRSFGLWPDSVESAITILRHLHISNP